MKIDKRPYDDKRTEEIPAPEGVGAEFVVDMTLDQGFAYPLGDLVVPEYQHDGGGEQGKQKCPKVVYGLGAIAPGIDLVKIEGKGNEEKYAVKPQCQNGQDRKLPHASVGLQQGGLEFYFLLVVGIFVCHVFLLCVGARQIKLQSRAVFLHLLYHIHCVFSTYERARWPHAWDD